MIAIEIFEAIRLAVALVRHHYPPPMGTLRKPDCTGVAPHLDKSA